MCAAVSLSQVGAHGTGATIPPVDEQVVGMKLVTPRLGTLELSAQKNPSLFCMAKVTTLTTIPVKCLVARDLLVAPCESCRESWFTDRCHQLCEQVGLGALGVVTEVTIKCVKRHQLLESTSVMTRAEVKSNHHALLRNNKHIR